MGNGIRKLKKEEIAKYYEIRGVLGKGSFATVKEAVRKADGRRFAIKIIKKSKLNAEELAVVHDEVSIMHKIDHPNCVKLYEMFETNKKLYMVLELLTGGELFDRIVAKGSYSEKEASALIKSITSAIKYLHSIGIVHRDLKPENLIYLDPSAESLVKITDFGLAKFRGQSDAMSTACGTPGYVAPEVLKNEKYGPAVDMWSLGVILYILLCGFPPFYSERTQDLYKQIKAGAYEFPQAYWGDVSAEAKDLVRGLLTVNPRRRLTASQVLEHRWITKEVSSKEFGQAFQHRLNRLVARRKLRRGVQMVMAVNRLTQIIKDRMEDGPSAAGASSSSSSSSSSKKRVSADESKE